LLLPVISAERVDQGNYSVLFSMKPSVHISYVTTIFNPTAQNLTKGFLFLFDTINPYVMLISPINNSVISTPISDVSWTINDMMPNFFNCSIYINGTINWTGIVNAGTSVVALPLVQGQYVVNVTCFDAVNNSNSSDSHYFSVLFTLLTYGLCDGCRYPTRNVTVILNNTYGVVNDCEAKINDYLPEKINCSYANLLLEAGRNTVNLTANINNVSNSRTYRVWAKTNNWIDMLPALIPLMIAVFALLVGFSTNFVGFFVVSGMMFIYAAYEFVSFSMITAVLCLCGGVVIMIKGWMIK